MHVTHGVHEAVGAEYAQPHPKPKPDSMQARLIDIGAVPDGKGGVIMPEEYLGGLNAQDSGSDEDSD